MAHKRRRRSKMNGIDFGSNDYVAGLIFGAVIGAVGYGLWKKSSDIAKKDAEQSATNGLGVVMMTPAR